jgi:hypothetical protein
MLRELCALCGNKDCFVNLQGQDYAFIQLLGRQIYRKQTQRT